MKRFKRYAIYKIPGKKQPDEKMISYNTEGKDMRYLHDLTNNEYVKIPWADPTQRDLQAFIKGYKMAKNKEIEFEYTEMEF